MPFKVEKLIVWQKSSDLATIVDEVSKKFPKEELYVLASQIKRAADSISLNIAGVLQDSQMRSLKDFLESRYVRILKS